MKIIIAYASAGAGHYKAAEAIYKLFRKNNPALEVSLVDVLDYCSLFFRENYAVGYTILVRHLQWLWAFVFYLTSLKSLRPLVNWIKFIVNSFNTQGFVDFLIRENPDYIISTHFLPPYVASRLKGQKKISSHLITVVTDFGVHPFWLEENTDIYVAASGFTQQDLLRRGIDKKQIRVLGIPTDEKFKAGLNRDSLANKFNLQSVGFTPLEKVTDSNPARKQSSLTGFTVLVITGSFGIGPIEEIADLLDREVQVLAVCAGNKGLYEKLNKKNYSTVKVFGFVNNIEELMAVSDLIITKPGGLTISELLVMNLVPVFVSPIPGQETTNVKALAACGIGLVAEDISRIKDIVLDYKNNPEKLDREREKIKALAKIDSVEEICNLCTQK